MGIVSLALKDTKCQRKLVWSSLLKTLVQLSFKQIQHPILVRFLIPQMLQILLIPPKPQMLLRSPIHPIPLKSQITLIPQITPPIHPTLQKLQISLIPIIRILLKLLIPAIQAMTQIMQPFPRILIVHFFSMEFALTAKLAIILVVEFVFSRQIPYAILLILAREIVWPALQDIMLIMVNAIPLSLIIVKPLIVAPALLVNRTIFFTTESA